MSFIRIRKDVLSKPLLETHEANLVEFYNKDGKLSALLFHEFSKDLWALVTSSDPDWEATLIRLGYIDVKMSPSQFIDSIG